MINVKITVGVFDTPEALKRVNTIRATLAALPNKGDVLFYDSADLRSMIAERKKSWGLDGDISLYYVRAIAYLSDGTPLIMLGAHEDMIATNYSYYDTKTGKWVYNNFMYLRYMPKKNDEVFVEKINEILYVTNCMHYPNSREISITLSSKEASTFVSIENEPIEVSINTSDTIPVRIEEVRRMVDPLPVKIEDIASYISNTVPVEVKDCDTTIPVKIDDVSSGYMPALRVDTV